MKKKAFIIGVTGQDGSYMVKFLLNKNYSVFGFTRSLKKNNLKNLEILKVNNQVNIKQYKDNNINSILKNILKYKPNEIYFFSGQSSVNLSFKNPLETYESNIIILFEILELIRKKKLNKIKVFNSSSTDCFGKSKYIYNDEKNLFFPISPYGRAKSFSFWLMKFYRENYKIHSKNGILSNHESPLRPSSFVLKRIINFAKKNQNKRLKLGNINIFRDWGWAPEFSDAIYKINNKKVPEDYVVGTGKITSLKYIIKKIFKLKKIDNKFLRSNTPKSLRPADIKKIGTNPKKIYKDLNWKSKTSIDQIIKKMILNELY
ncbi:GDP-mannose 4,6-dehydratase [Candidatus Pelagibacter sp.]|nr:GDP-mannose 4,6-dehydratase [Candidatus Pelagibacter sp.]